MYKWTLTNDGGAATESGCSRLPTLPTNRAQKVRRLSAPTPCVNLWAVVSYSFSTAHKHPQADSLALMAMRTRCAAWMLCAWLTTAHVSLA